jgi:acetoin utilization deacetylase AcuC-like enzyme
MSTLIVYDERMQAHQEANHPESPQRIQVIHDKIASDPHIDASKCEFIKSREATKEEITAVHTEELYNKLRKIPLKPREELDKLEASFNSIYINKKSFDCALLSAGGVVEATKRVVTGQNQNAIAIVRPPGHHAECSEAMGFCFFNNVAVAAEAALKEENIKKVAIIDWDVHHGNATQHQFYDRSDVLFISVHRFDHGRFYPGSQDANSDKIGKNAGKGFNINIPWNTSSSYHSPSVSSSGVNTSNNEKYGDPEYLYMFDQIIIPVLNTYQPDLILISAGFDCAAGDPLGGIAVGPGCFNYMTRMLMNYAQGRVVVALEGGYSLFAISRSMLSVAHALTSSAYVFPLNITRNVSPGAVTSVNNLKQILAGYWEF